MRAPRRPRPARSSWPASCSDRGLRVSALCAPLPGRRSPLRPGSERSAHGRPLRGLRGVAAARHEAAGRLLLGVAPRVSCMGVGAFATISLQGSILQMVNHGLSTGALFLLVGVLYERTHAREIDDLRRDRGGGARRRRSSSSRRSSWIGLPGLNGFVGEFLILVGTSTLAQLVGGRRGDRGDPFGDLHAIGWCSGFSGTRWTRGEQSLKDIRPSELIGPNSGPPDGLDRRSPERRARPGECLRRDSSSETVGPKRSRAGRHGAPTVSWVPVPARRPPGDPRR